MHEQPPTIELSGVRLRPLRPEDAVAWHACLSDPEVTDLTSYPEMSLADVRAMLERAHFTAEGYLRSFRVSRGQPRDFQLYSLLRSEWERSAAGP